MSSTFTCHLINYAQPYFGCFLGYFELSLRTRSVGLGVFRCQSCLQQRKYHFTEFVLFEGLARITLIKTLLTAQFLKRNQIQKSIKSWEYLMMKMPATACRSPIKTNQQVILSQIRSVPSVNEMPPLLLTSEYILTAAKQSPWTLIKSNLFLHRSRKTQTIDEVRI